MLNAIINSIDFLAEELKAKQDVRRLPPALDSSREYLNGNLFGNYSTLVYLISVMGDIRSGMIGNVLLALGLPIIPLINKNLGL